MQQSEAFAPETYPRRPAAVAALLSLFVFALSSNALPAVLLRAADGLAVSMGALAQVAAVQFAGFFIAAVAGGILADHVGKKCILLTACGLMLAGSVVWSLANNLPTAFAGGALMGLGGGVIESMSSTVLSDLFPDRRKFILNLSQVIYCAGAVVGPVIMGWLLPLGISWRVCFAGIAGAGLILTFLFARAILPVPAEDERIHLAALKAIVHRRTFILPCIAIFLYVLTETGVIVYGNAYLQTVHHAPERWAILFLSFFWIGMMAGRWGCALIPERIPYIPLIAGFLVIAALTLILQQWAGGWVSSLVLLTLTGAAFCGIWPLIVGLSASLNSGYSGTVLGVTIAAGSLGCVAAPTMLNTLFARVPPAAIFPITAVPLLLAALALLLIRQER